MGGRGDLDIKKTLKQGDLRAEGFIALCNTLIVTC